LLSKLIERLNGRLLSRFVGLNGSKFGETHGRWAKMLPKIETKIPEPLADDLPKFLATCSARTPTIRVLFLIFIRKDRLK
jgi:hypothetical protein